MIQQLHELLCIKCKTGLVVKASYDSKIVKYKLAVCPKCSSPIRDIRSDEDLSIHEIGISE